MMFARPFRRRASHKTYRTAPSHRLRFERLEARRLLTINFLEQDHVVADGATTTPEASADFGKSVAVDGDLMVVGAPAEMSHKGAAYIYRRNDNGTPFNKNDDTWQHEARLTASDAGAGDDFGFSVAISGETVVVGSRTDDVDTDGDGSTDTLLAGSAYIFSYNTGMGWNEEAKLIASDASFNYQFGSSVNIWDGSVVVGAVHGHVDTDGDGTIDVSDTGSAYVFEFDSGTGNWSQQAKLVASDARTGDEFGFSVGISGDSVVVGSLKDDLDTDGNGSTDTGDAGSAYIFTYNSGSGNWSQQTKLTASDPGSGDRFGYAVGISGDTLVVGSRFDDLDTDGDGLIDLNNAGSAYVFAFDSGAGNWIEQSKLVASNASDSAVFGMSVSISDGLIVVGSECADVDVDGDGVVDANCAGSAYVFAYDSGMGSWSEQAILVASPADDGDLLGASTAISGQTVVVGSPRDDLDTDSDGTVDLVDAGSAYAFVVDDPPPTIESVDIGSDLQSFIVQLNDDDLDASLAENTNNFRVTAAGADKVFDTGDDVTLAVSSVEYDAAIDRITVRTVDAYFDDLIRLEIDGDDAVSDGTPGVTDLAGNHIDGGDHTTIIDLRALSLVAELLTKAEALRLSTGAENSLTAKLDAALHLLDVETANDQGIVAKLEAFIEGVNHWYDKSDISLADRDRLVEDTEFIILGLSLI